jgi:hypothetical protein
VQFVFRKIESHFPLLQYVEHLHLVELDYTGGPSGGNIPKRMRLDSADQLEFEIYGCWKLSTA